MYFNKVKKEEEKITPLLQQTIIKQFHKIADWKVARQTVYVLHAELLLVAITEYRCSEFKSI